MSPNFFENKNYWVHELNGINSGMPKNRISIKDVLASNMRGYNTRDGFQDIPDQELQSFCENFSSEMYDKILIPLVFLHKGDHFVPSGNKYAIWAIEVLMGHELVNFLISISDYQPKYTYYYSYQVNKIRRKYPTIIQLIFSMS